MYVCAWCTRCSEGVDKVDAVEDEEGEMPFLFVWGWVVEDDVSN